MNDFWERAFMPWVMVALYSNFAFGLAWMTKPYAGAQTKEDLEE